MPPASVVPDIGEDKRGFRLPFVGRGHLFVEQGLIVEAGVAQADVALSGNRAAMTEGQAVVGQTLPQPQGKTSPTQPHGRAVVAYGGRMQTVALAETAGRNWPRPACRPTPCLQTLS